MTINDPQFIGYNSPYYTTTDTTSTITTTTGSTLNFNTTTGSTYPSINSNTITFGPVTGNTWTGNTITTTNIPCVPTCPPGCGGLGLTHNHITIDNTFRFPTQKEQLKSAISMALLYEDLSKEELMEMFNLALAEQVIDE